MVEVRKLWRFIGLLALTVIVHICADGVDSLEKLSILILADIIAVQVLAYIPKSGLSFYYVFISALALFHFGQILLYLCNIEIVTNHAYDLFKLYPQTTLFKTLKFCVKGYNLIALLGFVFAYRKKEKEIVPEFPQQDDLQSKNILNFGVITFWLLLIPLLIYDFSIIRLGLIYGYEAKYIFNNSLLASVDMYFPISIICIMAASPKDSKNWKYYYAFAIIRMALQMFIVGNRGPLIINLLIYELLRTVYHPKKETKKTGGKKIGYALAALAICFLVSFVAVSRGSEKVSFTEFLSEYNFIALFLSEFGSTLITPILVVLYTGRMGFLYGKTYLGGLAVLLPFSSQYMSEVRSYMNVGALMNPYSPNEGALGGSLFADMYINFGEFGIWISVLLGVIVGLFSNKMTSNKVTFGKCLLFYFANSLLLYVRGSSQDIFLGLKRIIYLAVIYCVYEYFTNRNKEKRVI